MQFRRRVPRQITGWIGSCRVEGEPANEHRECRVLDISEFGIGIMLDHTLGSELIGRHISVETPTIGTSVSIRLEGKVRNAVSRANGSVRVGIEFVGLTELEQSVVKALGVLSGAP